MRGQSYGTALQLVEYVNVRGMGEVRSDVREQFFVVALGL
jgi:hypothetical protein